MEEFVIVDTSSYSFKRKGYASIAKDYNIAADKLALLESKIEERDIMIADNSEIFATKIGEKVIEIIKKCRN